ncbi:helix-turn-helix domain-containing protein [Stenotrophomonas sp. PS02298]|uniref:winged helix-turn-helix transcriptional regulator n=1 Tax=Stenotrophomonas sp. PS02298 TaxID=2991424 RepID=UPI00249ADE39|nr:helix-turn-helix domain-containing protein [Stenotrophomonas sp. PS02298]
MSRRSLESDSPCPVARSLDLVGDRWSLLILRDAFDGVRRFGDFQRGLGVARNILTDRLRKLVDVGILQLHAASDGTAYQEYVLTPKGESLFPILVALRQWGEQHLYQRGERHSQLLDNRTGKPVPLMRLQGADGAALKAADTRVRKLA